MQLVRRVFVVYIVIYATQIFYYKIVSIMAATIAMGILGYQTETFKSKYDERMLSLTRLTILLTCYSFVCFSMIDVDANFTSGYFPIVIILSYMVIVFSLIIHGSFKVIRRKI